MCGIAGFIHQHKERPAQHDILKKMTDTLIHRGPDAGAYHVKSNLGLGHRRLSIIDLNTGDQPMVDEETGNVVVFNGEIYNYIELREELKKAGHSFRTASDTEVILKAYLEWGEDCLNHFNGMWAIAFWNQKDQSLIISRDRMGEKPVYFAHTDETFVFASEIKGLLAYGGLDEKSLEMMEVYLTMGFAPGPRTFYKHILELEPGFQLKYQDGSLQKKQYWALPQIPEGDMRTDTSAIYDEFEEIFRDSVRIRMRSDVPYGAFLSGGLDSASVVSSMSDISSHPIQTFTIGFNEKEFDESLLAKMVSDKFHTDHHYQLVQAEDARPWLQKVIYHYDQPFGDSSAIVTGLVSQSAREKVKMVLTGDGGDEVLSGYTGYQGEKFAVRYKKLPSGIRRNVPKALHLLSSSIKGRLRYKLNRAIRVTDQSNLDFRERFLKKVAHIDPDLVKQFVGSTPTLALEDYYDEMMKGCEYKDDFYKLMYAHFKCVLPSDMLMKVDRISMASSLETRLPFLDHRLVELMVKVHKDVKMKGMERKTVLRNTLGKTLPQALLTAPKKGFSVPLREWFKEKEYTQQVINPKLSKEIIDVQILNQIVKDNETGTKDYGNFMWSYATLEKWLG